MTLAIQKVDEFRAGQPSPKRRSNYRKQDNQLRNTALRYTKIPLIEYLRSIANGIRLC